MGWGKGDGESLKEESQGAGESKLACGIGKKFTVTGHFLWGYFLWFFVEVNREREGKRQRGVMSSSMFFSLVCFLVR